MAVLLMAQPSDKARRGRLPFAGVDGFGGRD
jgi:hypothetical protein